ncbi:MAG: MotA/TolQ/ExbB proton channel family protein [Desulfocurvibacter africanus]
MHLPELFERLVAYLQAGGSIMLLLAAISIVMWTLLLIEARRFLSEKRREVSPGECLSFCRDGQATDGKVPARWQRLIASGYMHDCCPDPELNRKTLGALRARQETQTMRHVGAILMLAAVAPLLGLLGTVSGMIATFDVIAESGTGNARALASGISTALVTTQSGLVVAVPGMALGGVLLRRAAKLKARMEIFCIGLQRSADGRDAIPEGSGE